MRDPSLALSPTPHLCSFCTLKKVAPSSRHVTCLQIEIALSPVGQLILGKLLHPLRALSFSPALQAKNSPTSLYCAVRTNQTVQTERSVVAVSKAAYKPSSIFIRPRGNSGLQLSCWEQQKASKQGSTCSGNIHSTIDENR